MYRLREHNVHALFMGCWTSLKKPIGVMISEAADGMRLTLRSSHATIKGLLEDQRLCRAMQPLPCILNCAQ